ncbi:hypothetical protein [Arenimonas caeni]|uniref:hypothetical protein n=1 Tax=Arenimonas caeni TaxID=2058085 RepID=UPI0013B04D40|nr:hypothetical protein [Arenimonas caeni]
MSDKVPGGLIGLLIGVAIFVAANFPFIGIREGWVCNPSFYCPPTFQDRWGESFPREYGILSWIVVQPALYLFDSLNSERISFAETRGDQAAHDMRLRTDAAYADDFREFVLLDLDEKIARSVEGVVAAKVRWGQLALGLAIFGNLILLLLVIKLRRKTFDCVSGICVRIWRWL